MVQHTLRVMVVAAAFLVAWNVALDGSQSAQAQSPNGAAWSNYYVPGGVPATLYPSPRPTPALVGQTYITYQPLAPHEFLYPHKRTYLRYNPGSGWTTTRIWWAN